MVRSSNRARLDDLDISAHNDNTPSVKELVIKHIIYGSLNCILVLVVLSVVLPIITAANKCQIPLTEWLLVNALVSIISFVKNCI